MLLAKIILATFCFLLISIPLALLYWSGWSDKKAKKWGKQTVEDLGYEYLRHQYAKAHYGMHFKANGKKYYVKYHYSHWITKFTYKWKDLSPEEMVEQGP